MDATRSSDQSRLEKVRMSTKNSIDLLDEAIKAQANKDAQGLEKKMFLALSELEYTQFMVSLVLKSTGFISELRRKRKSTEDLSSNLVRARDILKEVEPLIDTDLMQFNLKVKEAKMLVRSLHSLSKAS